MIRRTNKASVGDLDKSGKGHVLFLLSTLVIGGSERKTVRIANLMAASGRAVTVTYLNGPDTLGAEIAANVSVLCLERKGKFGFGALRRLVSCISSSGIDQVCCINTYPLLYGFLARFFVNSKSFRVLATINETEFVRRSDELKMYLFAPLFRRVDTVVFGSAYQQTLWVDQYRLNAAKCTYIHNGVDADFYSHSAAGDMSRTIRKKLGIPEKGLVVGSIGRFRKEKQYQFVIHACEELHKTGQLEVHCLLVGGGYEEQLLRDLVAELGCEAYVHLLDAEEDVRPYLEAMDIFVLSSISETFSNAALEAMAMSLPVVLPRVGGCPEMVKIGETGFIYEPGDLSEFVEFLSLLGSDDERRITMGQAARKYVESDFRFESMVASYAALFEGAV